MNFAALDYEKLARSAIQSINVKTTYGPPFRIEKPFEPGPPNPYLQTLKPEIEITFVTGHKTKMRPYGSPGVSQWPKIQAYAKLAGVLSGIALSTLVLYAVLPKKKR